MYLTDVEGEMQRQIRRHCERSEAIDGAAGTKRVDCFVAEFIIGRAFARPAGSSQ
jgi:hypothetical protein